MFVLCTFKLALIAMMTVSSATAFAPPASSSMSSMSSTMSLMLKANIDDDVESDSTIQNRRELFKSLPGRAAALSVIATGLVSGSGVDTIIRPPIAAAASATASFPDTTYGPLADLVGTWVGNQGFVMVAVPAPGSEPDSPGDFIIKEFPYREEFIIEKVGAALQVGGSIDQTSGVLKYTKKVWATAAPADGVIIHEENGMFFYLPNIVNNPDNGKPIDTKDQAPYSIGRSASVPHGNAAMMFGDSTDPGLAGAPDIPDISTLPSKKGPGYLAPYNGGLNEKPNAALKDALAKNGPVKSYYQISMTTDQKKAGGLVNTNFVNTRADTRTYSADFWIEQLENGKLQMQYSEIANIFFHKKGFSVFKTEIDWPHVMVNTLTKQ